MGFSTGVECDTCSKTGLHYAHVLVEDVFFARHEPAVRPSGHPRFFTVLRVLHNSFCKNFADTVVTQGNTKVAGIKPNRKLSSCSIWFSSSQPYGFLP